MYTNFMNRYGNEIKRTKSHIYIAPHPLLSQAVAHYTICPSLPLDGRDSIVLIPDASGCIYYQMVSSRFDGGIYGASTKTAEVKNDCHWRFFIEFRPSGLVRFARLPQNELIDQKLLLGQINPVLDRKIRTALERFAEEKKPDADELVRRIDQILLSHWPGQDIPCLIQSSVAHLRASGGRLPVERLAEMEFYSQRQLNRYFQQYMGMNVKTFSRLLRVNQVVKQLEQFPHSSLTLTDLAMKNGFYDQAHFIRDFKLVCGLTPKQYLNRMSNFYNEPIKLDDILGETDSLNQLAGKKG